MNWRAATETELVEPAIAEPEIESLPAPALSDAAEHWLCGWCHHRVASEKDRFKYNDKDEFTFANLDGIRFAIITFSQAPGCRAAPGRIASARTAANTWAGIMPANMSSRA